MNKIEIFEQELNAKDKNNPQQNKVVGKVAILRGGLNSENPTAIMNNAVSKYVGTKGHNQFVEIHLDNPWVRIVIGGINEVDYDEFTDQTLYNG
jgi:hypothetical protein